MLTWSVSESKKIREKKSLKLWKYVSDIGPTVNPPEKLCIEQGLRYVSDLGSWIQFPDTVHELYAHLPQALGTPQITIVSELIVTKTPTQAQASGCIVKIYVICNFFPCRPERGPRAEGVERGEPGEDAQSVQVSMYKS